MGAVFNSRPDPELRQPTVENQPGVQLRRLLLCMHVRVLVPGITNAAIVSLHHSWCLFTIQFVKRTKWFGSYSPTTPGSSSHTGCRPCANYPFVGLPDHYNSFGFSSSFPTFVLVALLSLLPKPWNSPAPTGTTSSSRGTSTWTSSLLDHFSLC